jgi:hypothetical protein
MSALGTKLRKLEGGKVSYWCPGCDRAHVLTVEPGGPGPCWDWDGDADTPTFSPSVLVKYPHWVPPVTSENLVEWKRKPWPQSLVTHVCHAFVTDGQVQFLVDSTHKLAGQTVPLPDFGVMQ